MVANGGLVDENYYVENAVLISAVEQSDSVIHYIYIHIHSFLYSFPLWFITEH